MSDKKTLIRRLNEALKQEGKELEESFDRNDSDGDIDQKLGVGLGMRKALKIIKEVLED